MKLESVLARNMILVVAVMGCAWAGSASASPNGCPSTLFDEVDLLEFKERHGDAYTAAETHFFVKSEFETALSMLDTLSAQDDLNNYGRSSVLRLIAVIHLEQGRDELAARALEQALRLGADRPIQRQFLPYASAVRLFRELEDADGEARIIGLWTSCGGEESDLLDWLSNCGSDLRSICLGDISGID